MAETAETPRVKSIEEILGSTGIGRGSRPAPAAPAEPVAEAAPPSGEAPAPPRSIEDIVGSKGVKPTQSTEWSKATQVPAGFNEGLANALGLPVDLVAGALRMAGAPIGETPFGGSASIKKGMGFIGANPDAIPISGDAEKYLRAAGRGAGEAVGMQGAVGGLTRLGLSEVAPKTTDVLNKLMGGRSPTTGPDKGVVGKIAEFGRAVAPVVENAVIGAGGGAGAEAAMETVPDKYKPIAGMGGGMAGGLSVSGLLKGVEALGPPVRSAVQNFFDPATVAGQRRATVKRLADSVTSVEKSKDILENEPLEILPKSRPTSPEVLADPKLGSLLLERQKNDAAPFMERRGERAAVRAEALDQAAPPGSPIAVSQKLDRELQNLENQERQITQQDLRGAQQAADNLGVQQPPEATGSAMRTFLDAAKKEMRDWRTRLYEAVDPQGRIQVVSSQIRDAARKVIADYDPLSEPMTGKIKGIYDDAANLGDNTPFKSLVAFDKRVNAAMSEELARTGTETPEYYLLTQVKKAVASSINDAVENQAAQDARAVAAGNPPPGGSIADRIDQWVKDFYAQKEGGKAKPPAQPTKITQEDVDAIAAAKLGHAAYAQTFKEGATGEALASAGGPGRYKVLDSLVGDKFFRPGPAGHEGMQSYMNAVGSDAAAVGVMRDHIVSSLKREAMTPQGTIDPRKFAGWRKKYQDALREFPDLERQFANASTATETAARSAADATTAINNFQTGLTKQLLKLGNEADVVKTVGTVFGKTDAVRQMRSLFNQVKADPDAVNGLRRSIVDYIKQRFIKPTEEGFSGVDKMSPGAFQSFVRDNRAALRQVLDDKQISSLELLAADLHRDARNVSGALIPGRSATGQLEGEQARQGKSILSTIGKTLATVGAGGAGLASMGVPGMVAGAGSVIGASIIHHMRMAGIDNIDKLLTRAMLEPEFMLELLKEAPRSAGVRPSINLTNQIAKGALIGELNAERPRELTIRGPGNRPTRATGGAVNLMALSKAAKKHVTRSTEDLLNESDDTVARALEVANKHI